MVQIGKAIVLSVALTLIGFDQPMEEISLYVDPTTHAALRKAALDSGWPLEDVVHDAIRRDLFRRSRAKKGNRPDERLIAPIRALLADDFNYAQGWTDLQKRLRNKGYELREAVGGLAVYRIADNHKCAKASDLGHAYARLIRRFQAPFPGHSHRYMFDRAR